jgi:hypothetical protein
MTVNEDGAGRWVADCGGAVGKFDFATGAVELRDGDEVELEGADGENVGGSCMGW